MLSLQQGHTADSCLSDSPRGFLCPFQQSYTPATRPPAHPLLRIVLCHSEHFMFYLSLRLVILVCLIFQLVKVFMWDGFSSGLAISPPTLVSDTKLMRLCLILVICVIYEHREWHYPSWRFTGHVLSVHLFSVI